MLILEHKNGLKIALINYEFLTTRI